MAAEEEEEEEQEQEQEQEQECGRSSEYMYHRQARQRMPTQRATAPE